MKHPFIFGSQNLAELAKLASKKDLETLTRKVRKNTTFVEDHREPILTLIKDAAHTTPRDLAVTSFFQFVNSARGAALVQMLSIQGKFGDQGDK